jgi:hypothetical protein
MRRTLAIGLAGALALVSPPAFAYPLDGFPGTGMTRLVAYRLAAQGSGRPSFLTAGEMLPSVAIGLRLVDHRDLDLPAPSPELQSAIVDMLGADAGGYGIAVLDFSDPERPRYGAHNADRAQQPGSVGKLVVLLAWFQALADVHPAVEDRQRLLYETEIVADPFIQTDSHDVPVWQWGMGSVDRRPIAIGDRANLWTWLDWMASASSNAAGSTMMKQLMLLVHFGKEYPVSQERADAFFRETPRGRLAEIFRDAMFSPLQRNGLDAGRLAQGSFFTRTGKERVPGAGSTATPGELLRYLLRMEQGKLVDAFSSLEIKKLLYLTDQRIRYASSPALDEAAVYFKSGSLYSCMPERGFQCGKFLGNRMNYMNSVVVVESIDREPAIRYAVVVLSNVLRKNSSEVHKELAARLHGVIESFHPARASAAGVATTSPRAPE